MKGLISSFPVLRTTLTGQALAGLALGALLAIPAFGAAPTTRPNRSGAEAPGSENRDLEITQRIQKDLVLDEQVPSQQIDVQTDHGVVTLSGTVNSLLAQERAGQIARAIEGVRRVQNQINLETGAYNDEWVRNHVLLNLASDPAADALDLDVQVRDGMVTLTGKADSWAERELAAQVAKGVPGVRGVRNGLSVELSRDRPDEEVQSEIAERLQRDPQLEDDSIQVQVQDGAVTLEGKVDSMAELKRATRQAWVAGVRSVDPGPLTIALAAQGTPGRAYQAGESRASRGDFSAINREIRSAVQRALRRDAGLPIGAIRVQAHRGVVTLSGEVKTLLARDRAVDVANAVRGVNAVENRIRVVPASRPDASIQDDVQEALAVNPVTEAGRIASQVSNGKVTLNGTVHSWQEKQTAGEVAKSIRGVRQVENELLVRYTSHRSDEEIAADVRSRLRLDARTTDDPITVQVRNGHIRLSGRVDSLLEKEAAIADAWVLNARSVDARALEALPPLERLSREPITSRAPRAHSSADGALQARLRTALNRNPLVDVGDIAIRVRDGTAYLDGRVESTFERLEAEQTASDLEGIRQVRNNLRVLRDTEGYETWPFFDFNPADDQSEFEP